MRKPSGFHWDFFLLGITTFIAGLLGVPAPNGLIPQAPLHTASLVVMGYDEQAVEDHAMSEMEDGRSLSPEVSHTRSRSRSRTEKPRAMSSNSSGLTRRVSRVSETVRDARQRRREIAEARKETREVPVSVVEQRVSNLAQGCLCEWSAAVL